jgi:transcription initiation factor IIE alpha subunit
MNEFPPEIPHLIQALTRLRVIFQATLDVELMDTEVAELAGLEDDECRILLAVLHQTGAIQRPRSRVFVCRRSSWWTAARVRSQPLPSFSPTFART